MGTVAMTKRSAGARHPSRIAAALADLARFGLIEGARRTYLAVTARSLLRRRLHELAGSRDHGFDKARSKAYHDDSHLVHVAVELVRLARAGATPTELYRYIAYLYQVLASLGVTTPRPLSTLDLAEQQLDGDEDLFFTRRSIHGLRPCALRDEAEVNRTLAAIYTERAAALDLRASRLELGVAS